MNKVTATINRHSKILLVVLVLLILLMGIFIITRMNQPDAEMPEDMIEQLSSIKTPYGELIENNSNTQIEYSGKILTVPEGWVIDSAYKNDPESDNLCVSEDENECKVYSVSNGIDKYFLSIPLGLRYQNGPDFESKPMIVNFAGTDLEFVAERLKLQTRSSDEENAESTNVEDSGLYLQIYGCNSDRFCAATSMLDFSSQEVNAKQVQDFKTLLSQMTIR